MTPELQLFYTRQAYSKFTFPKGIKLDTAGLSELKESGLDKMIKQGVACQLDQLGDGYRLVLFPKCAPSRPYEMLMTVLPKNQGKNPKSSLEEFSPQDIYTILSRANTVLEKLKTIAFSNSHPVTDGFVFQHYNPDDLYPKHVFNGGVSHLHLHIQQYGGHSLSDFPDLYRTDGVFREHEAANRQLRDSGVKIFWELISELFPSQEINLLNEGTISFFRTDLNSAFSKQELDLLQQVLRVWRTMWYQVSACFLDQETQQLLDQTLRQKNVKSFISDHFLSKKSQRILFFLADNVSEFSEDIWRNFYVGPVGALGYHLNYQEGTREWLVAPRAFRSWYRHLPLILAQTSPVTEWPIKDENDKDNLDPVPPKALLLIQQALVRGLSTYSGQSV